MSCAEAVTEQRGARVAAVVLVVGLVLVALRPAAVEEVRLPAAQCSVAQARALRGVGPKTAETVAASIRAWRLDALPPSIRSQVERFFRPDPEA